MIYTAAYIAKETYQQIAGMLERLREWQQSNLCIMYTAVYIASAVYIARAVYIAKETCRHMAGMHAGAQGHLESGCFATCVGPSDDHSAGFWPHTHVDCNRSMCQHRFFFLAHCKANGTHGEKHRLTVQHGSAAFTEIVHTAQCVMAWMS